jgi:hypothetical protein
MKRKSAVKKKAAIRKFENGTQEWVDYQTQVYCAAEEVKRRKWEADLEKSKQRFNPFVAEKYLNAGMEVLEHFGGTVMFPGLALIELNRLGRVIARHTARCLSLLCQVAEHGEPSAARTVFDASVRLAPVVHWIVRNRPAYLPEMKDQSCLPQLLAWAKAGEIACGSVLKLKEGTKVRPDAPATRLVFDFMKKELTLRSELIKASEFFNRSATHGRMTLERHLIDRCKFPPERIFYKDLPEFSSTNVDEWWEEVLKPHLDDPETLRSVRWYHPAFFKTLETAAISGEAGASKDYRIKDQLKKRCHAALKNLAASLQVPSPSEDCPAPDCHRTSKRQHPWKRSKTIP